VHPGDLVILIAYAMMSDADAREYVPRVVFVDSENRVVGTGSDPAEALPQSGLLRGDHAYPAGSHDDDPTLVW
jgi:aspartate 1-decarboxylase